MTDIKVKCSACGHFTRISGTEQNRAYEQGRLDERPKAFANGYESGYQQGRADERESIEKMLENMPTVNGYIDSAWLWHEWEQLKEQEKNEYKIYKFK